VIMKKLQENSGFREIKTGMFLLFVLWQAAWMLNSTAQGDEVDDRVKAFLDEHRGSWRDLNVPSSDGRLLHDLIVERGFTRGFEIGTSTGHSTIWIAWAMRKTGGKLITVEIDERRQAIARRNIEDLGLDDYVEFLLGDAHVLTPAQTGPFLAEDGRVYYWRVSADGGQPQKVRMDGLAFPSVHPDGRHIAFTAGKSEGSEVWVMQNFLPDAGAAR